MSDPIETKLPGKIEELKPVSRADWMDEGQRLFGTDFKKWRFKCIRCGHVQTAQDFIDLGIENWDGVFYYSCIGRWKKGVGCDWTLGGLFQIHTKEVFGEEGKPIPVFEYAKEGE